MNTKFITKMVQAKTLEYEAIKEVLPISILKHVEIVEKDIMNGMRECIQEYATTQTSQVQYQRCEKETVPTDRSEVKQKVRKVVVE